MASQQREKYKIVNGPQRLNLSVGLFYVGKNGRGEDIVFKLESSPSPHSDEIEVDLTMIRTLDKIFGVWEFEGKALGQNVKGTYSSHRKDGFLEFCGLTR